MKISKVDQTMPVEIWADMLEDAGVDTGELRAWLIFGSGDTYATGYGDGYGSLCGGDGFWYNDATGKGHGNGYGSGQGVGNGIGYSTRDKALGNGYGSGDGYGNGSGL